MDIKKELRDQSLHFGIGLALTLLFSITLNIAMAAFIVMFGAWIREGLQRVRRNDNFFNCGQGCRLDLLFWAIGIGSGILIKIFLL